MKKIIGLMLIAIMSNVCFAIDVAHYYFNNANEMVSYINKLSLSEYATLKVWVQNSNNNAFGIAGSPYNIIYIKDKEKGIKNGKI